MKIQERLEREEKELQGRLEEKERQERLKEKEREEKLERERMQCELDMKELKLQAKLGSGTTIENSSAKQWTERLDNSIYRAMLYSPNVLYRDRFIYPTKQSIESCW